MKISSICIFACLHLLAGLAAVVDAQNNADVGLPSECSTAFLASREQVNQDISNLSVRVNGIIDDLEGKISEFGISGRNGVLKTTLSNFLSNLRSANSDLRTCQDGLTSAENKEGGAGVRARSRGLQGTDPVKEDLRISKLVLGRLAGALGNLSSAANLVCDLLGLDNLPVLGAPCTIALAGVSLANIAAQETLQNIMFTLDMLILTLPATPAASSPAPPPPSPAKKGPGRTLV